MATATAARTAPSPKPSRRAQKAATREALRDAAMRCFRERGLRATTIADITAAAGVAQGTFYVHFAGKEAVVEAMLEDFNAAMARRLSGAWSPDAVRHPTAFVRRVAEVFLDEWLTHSDFVRVYAEHAAGGLDLERLRDGINPPMRRFLHEALVGLAAARGAGAVPVDLVAHGLLGMWLRLGLQTVLGQANRDVVAGLLVSMSMGALDAVFSSPQQGGK